MNQPLPVNEPQPSVLPPPATPLAARLLNVFAVPGEVFEEVKRAKSSLVNWLVPILFSCVVGIAYALIVFSQPAIQQRVREQQAQAMEPQIKAGHMTQAQADQWLDFFGPPVLKTLGATGAVIASFCRVFWWALVLWLLGRWFLKVRFGYMKAVEVAGLASMIAVLGTIVTLLLIVNLGKLFSTPSLALAVSDFDVNNKSHLLLGAINVFSLWLVGVLAVGLGRLAGVAFARAAFLVFSCWVAQELIFILIGPGQFAL